jgi:hypothetical protein
MLVFVWHFIKLVFTLSKLVYSNLKSANILSTIDVY